jgi:hypothetical protein
VFLLGSQAPGDGARGALHPQLRPKLQRDSVLIPLGMIRRGFARKPDRRLGLSDQVGRPHLGPSRPVRFAGTGPIRFLVLA